MRIFSTLHIPDAVWYETVGQGRVLQEELLKIDIIKRHALSPVEINQFTTEKGLKNWMMVSVNVFIFASKLVCLLF